MRHVIPPLDDRQAAYEYSREVRRMRAAVDELADWFWDNNLPHFADKVRAINAGQP